MYAAWYDMVTDYSRRSLTYVTDRLPAFSALANYMSIILDDEYAAGLWRGDLTRGLLWHNQSDRGRRCAPPQLYVAPSWSWASMSNGTITMDFAKSLGDGIGLNTESTLWEGGATDSHERSSRYRGDSLHDDIAAYPDSCDEYGIEIADISCMLSGRNPFGEVINGRIRLNGWVKRGVISLPTQDLFDPDSGDLIGGLNLDEPLSEMLEGSLVWCLFLAWNKASYAEEETCSTTCLALLPTGLGENECRRIGLVGIKEQPWANSYEEMQLVLV